MYKWNVITYILCALVIFAYGWGRSPLWIILGLACLGTAVWYVIKSAKEKKKDK